MIKSFFVFLRHLTNVKNIIFILGVYLIPFLPLQFFPDIAEMGKIENKQEALYKLLTTTIGFYGLLLTVLIVIFNLHVKAVRRQAVILITENRWLQWIYSSFLSNCIGLTVSYFFIKIISNGESITLLYISTISTIVIVLTLFPAALLCVQEGLSTKMVKSLVLRISKTHILEFSDLENSTTAEREINPIYLVREILIAAVNDKDWALAEEIFLQLRSILIRRDSSYEISSDSNSNVIAWIKICQLLRKEVIKNGDSITADLMVRSSLATISACGTDWRMAFLASEELKFFIDCMEIFFEKKLSIESHYEYYKLICGIFYQYIENFNNAMNSELKSEKHNFTELSSEEEHITNLEHFNVSIYHLLEGWPRQLYQIHIAAAKYNCEVILDDATNRVFWLLRHAAKHPKKDHGENYYSILAAYHRDFFTYCFDKNVRANTRNNESIFFSDLFFDDSNLATDMVSLKFFMLEKMASKDLLPEGETSRFINLIIERNLREQLPVLPKRKEINHMLIRFSAKMLSNSQMPERIVTEIKDEMKYYRNSIIAKLDADESGSNLFYEVLNHKLNDQV